VDLFRGNKNLKLLDSFRFVRIRIRIPHPYYFRTEKNLKDKNRDFLTR
jgi:hypothetical protein